MCMWDRNFESSVTGSEMWSCAWSNKRVKSCYCARARLSTDQGSLSPGQLVACFEIIIFVAAITYVTSVTAKHGRPLRKSRNHFTLYTYDPPPSAFSGYPFRHLPNGPRPCPHVRARVHLPAATDLQLLLHGYSLQQADNDARIMQGLTPRNVTECKEICQGARRRRRSGRVIDL